VSVVVVIRSADSLTIVSTRMTITVDVTRLADKILILSNAQQAQNPTVLAILSLSGAHHFIRATLYPAEDYTLSKQHSLDKQTCQAGLRCTARQAAKPGKLRRQSSPRHKPALHQ